MRVNGKTLKDGVLEQLTLPELIDVWAEDEIYRRLQEVDLFSTTIVREAQRRENLLVMPLGGGSFDARVPSRSSSRCATRMSTARPSVPGARRSVAATIVVPSTAPTRRPSPTPSSNCCRLRSGGRGSAPICTRVRPPGLQLALTRYLGVDLKP